MKRYNCITGPDDEIFCKRVSDKLNHDWQFHAGRPLTFDGQALVKEVEAMDTTISAY